MRRFAALIAAICVAASVAPARAAYGPAQLLFKIQDPEERIIEASGLTASSFSPRVLFVHNDSGSHGRFFALGPDGSILATYYVVPPAVYPVAMDWEDMARGPGGDGKPALYFGDIGDNSSTRPFVVVYEVTEPVVDENATGTIGALPSRAHVLTYEDGAHDAETLLVDPRSGQIVIVTKEADGVSGIYLADTSDDPIRTLRRIASVPFAGIAGDPSQERALLTTGGDIASDRSRVAIRTYVEAFEWTLGDDDLAAAFSRAPERIDVPVQRQAEALCYTANGSDLITTSEGIQPDVWLLPRR